jgi:hypothetical protein
MALSHAPQIVSDGLIIYLDANNTSSYAGTGSTWYDLSGNSRHASLISSPSYEGFGRGKYLSFDGSTNYATIPYTITDNLITVSFWYYSKIFSANSSLDALISNFTSGISGFDVRLNSSTTINLAIVIDGSQSQINISTITNNTWYHVAFTYDGATVKTYLDAVFKSSTNVIGTRANGTQICIGTSAYDTNRKATCGVPQVMIYNRALSDAEILQNYNATKGRYIVNENIVRDGLILQFDAGNTRSYSGTGNTGYSISGVGVTASLINGTSFSNANGGSFVLDGSNDHIILNDFYLTQSGSSNEYTIVASGKLNTISSGVRQLISSDSGGYDWSFGSSGTGYFIFTGAGSTSASTQDLNWHIFAAQWNSAGSKLYVDNSLLINTTVAYDANINQTFIGKNPTVGFGEYWNGNVGTVLIYNRILTAQELTQNYNALKNRYGLT